jgi:hypothetical protein
MHRLERFPATCRWIEAPHRRGRLEVRVPADHVQRTSVSDERGVVDPLGQVGKTLIRLSCRVESKQLVQGLKLSALSRAVTT